MKVLDLFCGAGGAAYGIGQACPDSDIHGYDIVEQPDYPYSFHNKDWKEAIFDDYDFIWASPPCQAYSIGGNENSRKKYPRLIDDVRKSLLEYEKPFVIENVPRAPLRKDLMLCGEMFGLKVIRHRIFEIHGFKCRQPPIVCSRHKGKVVSGEYIMVCRGGRPGCFGDKNKRRMLKPPNLMKANEAMGITHITSFDGVCESIPPAYSKYILTEFNKQWDEAKL